MTSTFGNTFGAESKELEGIEVYGPPFSTFTRTIKMAFIEFGIPFKPKEFEPHSKEIKELNPFGLSPVLVHRDCQAKYGHDIVLYESNAIRRYIDEHLSLFRSTDYPGPLTPTANEKTVNNAVYARAKLDQSVSSIAQNIFPGLEHGFIKPVLALKDKGESEKFIMCTNKVAGAKVKALLQILEDQFDGPFLSGHDLLWDDLFLFPILDDLRSTPLCEAIKSTGDYPKLGKWLEAMLERDSAVKTRAGTISENLAQGDSD